MAHNKPIKGRRPARGAPSKYKPEYDAMLIDHMISGLSFECFSGLISVHPDTVNEWVLVHPSFSEAKSIGKQKRLLTYEQTMHGLATGAIQGNTAAMVFKFKNINNRKTWKDNPIDEEDANKGNTGIQITFSRANDITLNEVLSD